MAVAGPGKKEWADKSISEQMEQQMQQRTPLVAKAGGENAPVSVVQGDNAQAYTAQVVVPIISEGESTGAVVVLSRKRTCSCPRRSARARRWRPAFWAGRWSNHKWAADAGMQKNDSAKRGSFF